MDSLKSMASLTSLKLVVQPNVQGVMWGSSVELITYLLQFEVRNNKEWLWPDMEIIDDQNGKSVLQIPRRTELPDEETENAS